MSPRVLESKVVRWMRASLVASVLALTAAGCFSEPEAYPNGALKCAAVTRECPDGYLCGADDRCYATGASPDGGTSGPCTEGERRCDGNGPQRCDAANRWVSEPACPAAFPLCQAGHCVAGCTTGQTRCTPGGNAIEQCDAQGIWHETMQCTFACAGGSCAGECTPGAKRCGSAQTPETCDQAGHWVRATAPCPFTCTGDGECGGACAMGAKRCADATRLQLCNADSQWATPVACPYVCDSATSSCTGECSPGSKRCSGLAAQTCDASGRWMTTQTCNPVCSNGNCAACTNGDRQCNQNRPQTCSSGVWVSTTTSPCPYVCDPNLGCTGECVPGSQVCAGNTARKCGANGRWTDTLCPNICSQATGDCGGVCAPGARRCAAGIPQQCSAAGQWADAGPVCQFGCNAANGMCNACTPNPDNVTCAGRCGAVTNNCGTVVQCSTVCAGTGQTCGGGGTAGVCGCTPEPLATTCSGGRCGSPANNCGQVVTCGNTCTAPQTCGGGGVSNMCGCTPLTMCPAGKNCGSMPNGCGGTVSCGPDVCAGTGQTCTANVCGCVQNPNICAGRCGTITDNCGAAVNCTAPCPMGQTCGGGANPMPTVCG